jgi:molybdopterin-guanine dinucleotide biosynthesis protein A/ribosomal protein S18 acetylase RimI-like enzyme
VQDSRYEVVVVAGGRSRRYGSDKLADLLAPTLDSLPAEAAVVCVGPPRATVREVRWVREDPAFGGPLAAVAAGLALCTRDVAVLVGGDMPAVGAAIPALVAVALGGRAAVLVGPEGRLQPLASAWPRDRLADRLDRLGDPSGLALMRLLEDVDAVHVDAVHVDVVHVVDVWGAARDIDRKPPSVTLAPMTPDDYATYAATVDGAYAREVAEATGRPYAEVLPEAEALQRSLLPAGPDTPGHRLHRVLDAHGVAVGILWVGPSSTDPRQAWVFDIELEPAARGRGLGRAAMLAAEDVARSLGFTSIGLNVFAANSRAAALYRSLGYRLERSQLRKPLPPTART